jgi:hypothetical protein
MVNGHCERDPAARLLRARRMPSFDCSTVGAAHAKLEVVADDQNGLM